HGGQGRAKDELFGLQEDQEATTSKGVGHDPADDGQQQQRPDLGERERPHERARSGELVGVGAQHHRLHPRPDVRRERAEPHESELAVGEGRAGRAAAADVVVALEERFLAVFDDRGGGGGAEHGDLPSCHGAPGRDQARRLSTVGRAMSARTLPAEGVADAHPDARRDAGLGPIALVGFAGAVAVAWGAWRVAALPDRRARLGWIPDAPILGALPLPSRPLGYVLWALGLGGLSVAWV